MYGDVVDLQMSLVVILLGVTGLKRSGSCASWTCFGEMGRTAGVI